MAEIDWAVAWNGEWGGPSESYIRSACTDGGDTAFSQILLGDIVIAR